jgi:hypothetical protein
VVEIPIGLQLFVQLSDTSVSAPLLRCENNFFMPSNQWFGVMVTMPADLLGDIGVLLFETFE